jgi:uncharacterized protein (TIGR02147 family)
MTELPIFGFEDYRDFLRARVGPEGTRSGIRLSIAKAISCHSSYLTKILDGGANLSLEQGLAVCRHFRMTGEESEYFLLLIQRTRAGTRELDRYFATKLDCIKKARLQLKTRVPIRKSLSPVDQSTYYSSWSYAAIHMALTVPRLRTRAALAKHFGLSDKKVGETLGFLTSVGLAEEKAGNYLVGATQLHLEGDSLNIVNHHVNWRNRAVLSLERADEIDLHYSGVMTLSGKTAERLRERFVKLLQETISEVTKEGDEERVHCLALDWFDLRDPR